MSSAFASFGLRQSLCETLKKQGFVKPTEIQKRVIPAMMSGHSVVGVAETGSGKTLAYALPLMDILKRLEDEGRPVTAPAMPRAAVLVPTRELGEQVTSVFKTFTHGTRLRVRTVIGSTSLEVARSNVRGPFEILVATPGRLLQFLDDRRVSLSAVRHLVLDEADQLMDLGFLNEAARIVDACSPVRQIAMFSATIPPKVETLISEVFEDPVVIKTRGSQRMVATVETSNRSIQPRQRLEALLEILAEAPELGTLIFTNTRDQADTLAEQLVEAEVNVSVYHGELERAERRANLRAFRDGHVSALVTTDLGSRGLDLDRAERVINYYLPRTVELYLHRSGRTARAGRAGLVINLVTERDYKLIRQLEGRKAISGKRS